MSTETKPAKFNLSKILDYGRKPRVPSKYASFNRRMLAATLDSILLLAFLPLANILAPVQTTTLGKYTIDENDPESARKFLLHVLSNPEFVQSWASNFMMQILFWCVFSAICWHFWSATPGKMLLRMKIVDAKTEGRISDLQIFLRSFGYLISATVFCLGFFWIGLNKKRRGWHDYLGDTVVINLPLIPWKKPAPPKPGITDPEASASPGDMDGAP
jgi:uncharacterized RDD family membrane protein YckC